MPPVTAFTTSEIETEGRETGNQVPATDRMVAYSISPQHGKYTNEFYSDSYTRRFAMHVKASNLPRRMSAFTTTGQY
jgi:hypothetical protein